MNRLDRCLAAVADPIKPLAHRGDFFFSYKGDFLVLLPEDFRLWNSMEWRNDVQWNGETVILQLREILQLVTGRAQPPPPTATCEPFGRIGSLNVKP